MSVPAIKDSGFRLSPERRLYAAVALVKMRMPSYRYSQHALVFLTRLWCIIVGAGL